MYIVKFYKRGPEIFAADPLGHTNVIAYGVFAVGGAKGGQQCHWFREPFNMLS